MIPLFAFWHSAAKFDSKDTLILKTQKLLKKDIKSNEQCIVMS